jgi:hypothetical protein
MQLLSNPILDIILGLVLIYALLSILVSIMNEWLSHAMSGRSKMLHASILKLLSDPYNLAYGELFFNHFSIRNTMKEKPYRRFLFFKNKKAEPRKIPPQYISSSLFADALMDIIASQSKYTKGITMQIENDRKVFVADLHEAPKELIGQFRDGLTAMNPSPFRDVLQSYLDKAGNDYTKLKALIESWFNDYMDRVSGWYKEKQQKKLLLVSLLVVLMLNVDSLHLIKVLSMDDQLRNKLVEHAEVVADRYRQLNDSLREDIGAQVKTVLLNDTGDSAKRMDSAVVTEKPSILVKMMSQGLLDSSQQRSVKWILVQDSISRDFLQKSDAVLGTVAALNIPIGYTKDKAPVSWFSGTKIQEIGPGNNDRSGLQVYNNERNRGHNGWVYIKYIAGLLISVISLSFGAPFWFSMLIKLVDIRRAGVKPKQDGK